MKTSAGCGTAFVLVALGLITFVYLAPKDNSPDPHIVYTDPNSRTETFKGQTPIHEHKYTLTGEVWVSYACVANSYNVMLQHTQYGDAITCWLDNSQGNCNNNPELRLLEPEQVVVNGHVATRCRIVTLEGWTEDDNATPGNGHDLLECKIQSVSKQLGPPEDDNGNVIRAK